MNKFLNDDMVQKMVEAVMAGKTFVFNSDNVQIKVTTNGMQILYTETPKESNKDEEIKIFLEYCANLDDDFFVEVCDSFADGELELLQNQLDTDAYQDTIVKFKQRIHDIAQSKLSEISAAANAELQNQELIISQAQSKIQQIEKDIETANIKYQH